jgi:para-aminobenzoate synthetase component 1
MENRKPAITPSLRAVSFRNKGWIEPVSIFPSLASDYGFVWLDSSLNDARYGRWSYMMTRPFMTLSGAGNVFRLKEGGKETVHEGDPFTLLDGILRRFRVESATGAMPLFTGGAVGFLGYGLLRFTEPSAQLPRGTRLASEGDLWLGFYDRVLAFDHERKETWLTANHDHGSDPAPILDDLERTADEAVRRGDVGLLSKTFLPLTKGEWREAPRGFNSILSPKITLQGQIKPPPLSASTDSAPSLLRRGFGRESGVTTSADVAKQRELKLECPFTKESYVDAVEKVRLYIERGDILQANISRKIVAHGKFDPVSLYLRLRAINPAPFAAYVNGGGFRILSSSPERFIRLQDGQAQTRPIKGTRPRGRDADEDDRLRHELTASEKDIAENVMIVDLMRNDLSKVCQPFTVNVAELCAVERFATVFHLTSTVEGKLKPELTPVDLIRASFPPGSVTGAPKLRALEIIDEVEPDPRGAYCGSIGWIGYDGSMDTSVAIRMMVHTDEGVRLHSGGGVTYPSRPEDEYDETSVKAAALLEALLRS